MMRLILAMMFMAALTACRGGGDRAVPRPTAYPRIELPAVDYAPVGGMPFAFEANRAATSVKADSAAGGAVWLTVDYPRHGASIYLTFTPVATPAEAAEVAANRCERFGRDIGRGIYRVDGESAVAPFTVYATDSPTPTPAAAILVSPRWVVSGAVALRDGDFTTRPDSLAGVRDYLMEDFWHGFQTLRPWN